MLVRWFRAATDLRTWVLKSAPDLGFLFATHRLKSVRVWLCWDRVWGVWEQAEFDGMPEPGVLRRVVTDGQCVVRAVGWCSNRYDACDLGMRNLALVALTDAGRRVDEVAAVFRVSATYGSILRGRAPREGSAGLVRRRGRPAKLSVRQGKQAVRWADEGRSQGWIAERFGVARSLIGRVLAGRAPVAGTPELDLAQPDHAAAAAATATTTPTPTPTPRMPAPRAPSPCPGHPRRTPGRLGGPANPPYPRFSRPTRPCPGRLMRPPRLGSLTAGWGELVLHRTTR